MTTSRIALGELLGKSGLDGLDFLREGARVVPQGLMELKGSQQIGDERSAYRDGYWERHWASGPAIPWWHWCEGLDPWSQQQEGRVGTGPDYDRHEQEPGLPAKVGRSLQVFRNRPLEEPLPLCLAGCEVREGSRERQDLPSWRW